MKCPYCDMELESAVFYADHLIDKHRVLIVDYLADVIEKQMEFWAEVCGVQV